MASNTIERVTKLESSPRDGGAIDLEGMIVRWRLFQITVGVDVRNIAQRKN